MQFVTIYIRWGFTLTDSTQNNSEALKLSEEQLRRAIEEAPIPTIMQAEDGQVLQLSSSWTDLTGYKLSDMPTFDNWVTNAVFAGAENVRNHMHELFKGDKKSINIEFTVRTHKQGIRNWSFSASSPGTLLDGRRFIIGMAVDITERKKIEEEVARIASFPTLNPSPIVEADFEGKITYLNPVAKRTLVNIESLGASHPFLVDWQNVVKTFKTNSDSIISREVNFIDHWYLQTLQLVPEGECIRVYSVDITKRKKVEEELKTSEQNYRSLYNAISGGVVVQNINGEIVETNKLAREILGLTKDDISGRTSTDPRWEAIHEDGTPFTGETHPAMMTLKTGKPVRDVVMGVFNPNDKQHRWIMVNAEPMLNSKGKLSSVATTFVEITKRKIAEESLTRQKFIQDGVNTILEATLKSTHEELGEVCLKVAEKVTKSAFGFIGEINPKGLEDIAISNPGWDACKLYSEQGHRRPPGNFKIHGLYGKVISEGKGFYTNDPAHSPARIGLPEGHPPLKNFLGVPLIDKNKTIGIIAVANKEGGFGDEDLAALEALAPIMVEAFARKKAEEALKDNEERLKMAQQVAHVGTFEWNIQTGVNKWTPELEAMYGLPTGGFKGYSRCMGAACLSRG